MTKLEKILGTALVVVSTGYAYTAYTTIKHIIREREFYAHLQEECEKIKESLNNSANSTK